MLTRFTVSNFKSFGLKPQAISFLANSAQRHSSHFFNCGDLKVLRFSAIYGANASGKSSLVYSMAFARDVAVNVNGPVMVDGNVYCRLNPSNKEKTSYFEFEMEIDGDFFSYGFEMIINRHFITEEWLVKLEPEKERPLFTKNNQDGHSFFNREYFKMHGGNVIESLLALNARNGVSTFLSLVNQQHIGSIVRENFRLKVLVDVWSWLFRLQFAFPDRPFSGYQCFVRKTPDEVFEELSKFDTGITHISTNAVTENQVFENMPEPMKMNIRAQLSMAQADSRNLRSKGSLIFNNGHLINAGFDDNGDIQYAEYVFEHNNRDNSEFVFGEESDGTKRIVDLLNVLICSEEDSAIIIDELDRSLHPLLTKFFVKEFLRLTGNKKLQLIITTHESSLLNLNDFRQDEIWFVERSESAGESILIPLDRFKERFDKKIEKAYLDGRYGAIPALNQAFQDDGTEVCDNED